MLSERCYMRGKCGILAQSYREPVMRRKHRLIDARDELKDVAHCPLHPYGDRKVSGLISTLERVTAQTLAER